jgi:hypothetical protein
MPGRTLFHTSSFGPIFESVKKSAAGLSHTWGENGPHSFPHLKCEKVCLKSAGAVSKHTFSHLKCEKVCCQSAANFGPVF